MCVRVSFKNIRHFTRSRNSVILSTVTFITGGGPFFGESVIKLYNKNRWKSMHENYGTLYLVHANMKELTKNINRLTQSFQNGPTLVS
jgi:hypothetical protein